MSALIGPLIARTSAARLRRVPGLGVAAAAVLALAALAALLGPLIVADPNAVDLFSLQAAPSAAHPLGTDGTGRDLLARLVTGLRTALIGPLLVVTLAVAVAVPLVLVATWWGGWLDNAVARLLDVLMALPGLLIAIVASALLGASLTVAALALSVSYVPYIARVVRAQALQERRRPYVEALWLQGVPAPHIAVREILPNLAPGLVGQIVLSLSYAVIDLAALSYLGLGVQPPTADLGTMVSTGQTSVLQGHPAETVYASLVLVVLVVALGVVGDAIGRWAER